MLSRSQSHAHLDFQNEAYTLQFRFDSQYPISSPAVQFVVTEGKQAPIHPVRFGAAQLFHLLLLTSQFLACLLKRTR